MTDGIIQKVFNIAYQRAVSGNEQRNIKRLQQELIEKIKQVCATSNEESCFCSRLIGDNK